MFYWWSCLVWLRLLCRLGKILFVPAKSIQKPREQKNSSGDRIFDWAFEVSVFHVYDFLPLLRRVIRKSCFRALEQFLLTFLQTLWKRRRSLLSKRGVPPRFLMTPFRSRRSCSPRFQPWVTRSHSPLTVLTVNVAVFWALARIFPSLSFEFWPNIHENHRPSTNPSIKIATSNPKTPSY